MWAPGNRPARYATRGFTLLELLLVVFIIALASAGVGFALRGQDQVSLDREAQRLVALLEAARAQSRTSGLPVFWHAQDAGFAFEGLPNATQAVWLAQGVSVSEGATLVLGPEPIIGPQHVDLLLAGRSLRIATDGLRPFAVQDGGNPSGVTP